MKIKNSFHLFLQALPEVGQGLVEYALILVLIVIIILVVLVLLGPAVGNLYSNVAEGLTTPTPIP